MSAQIIEFPSQPSHVELWAEFMMLGQRMGHEHREESRQHWLEVCSSPNWVAVKSPAELREMIHAQRDKLREYAKGVLDEVGWD